MPHFRPYQVIPGHPITIIVETADGGRAQVVGTVARVTDVAAPSTVLAMQVTDAQVTALPAR